MIKGQSHLVFASRADTPIFMLPITHTLSSAWLQIYDSEHISMFGIINKNQKENLTWYPLQPYAIFLQHQMNISVKEFSTFARQIMENQQNTKLIKMANHMYIHMWLTHFCKIPVHKSEHNFSHHIRCTTSYHTPLRKLRKLMTLTYLWQLRAFFRCIPCINTII